jgi:hypothetical protein
VHPDHLRNADASRTNHTQRIPYESKDIMENISGYELVNGSLNDTLEFVRANVSDFVVCFA